MPSPVVNVALGAALAATAGMTVAMRTDLRMPNREAMPEMVRTAAYDSFAPNPNFADGKTLRRPPAGTVMRPLRTVAPPRDPLARGAAVFATFCQPCHGASAKGDGAVAQRGYPAPASLLGEKVIALTDDDIFGVVSKGKGNMPPYAAQIAPEDRRKVIAYVRSLQKGGAK